MYNSRNNGKYFEKSSKNKTCQKSVSKRYRTLSSVVNQLCKIIRNYQKRNYKNDQSNKDTYMIENFCLTCVSMKHIGHGPMKLYGLDGNLMTIQRGSTGSHIVPIILGSPMKIRQEVATKLKAVLKICCGEIMSYYRCNKWTERKGKIELFELSRSCDNSDVIVDITKSNVCDLLNYIVRNKQKMLRYCPDMFNTRKPIAVDKTNMYVTFDSIVYRLFAEILEAFGNNVDFSSLPWIFFGKANAFAFEFLFPEQTFLLPSKDDIISMFQSM